MELVGSLLRPVKAQKMSGVITNHAEHTGGALKHLVEEGKLTEEEARRIKEESFASIKDQGLKGGVEASRQAFNSSSGTNILQASIRLSSLKDRILTYEEFELEEKAKESRKKYQEYLAAKEGVAKASGVKTGYSQSLFKGGLSMKDNSQRIIALEEGRSLFRAEDQNQRIIYGHEDQERRRNEGASSLGVKVKDPSNMSARQI